MKPFGSSRDWSAERSKNLKRFCMRVNVFSTLGS
jgi:hypothetical protein